MARPEIDLEAGITSSNAEHPAENLSDLAYADQSSPDQYYRKLLRTTFEDGHSKLSYGFLSFDVLHRLILLNHQKKLAKHVENILRNGTTSQQELLNINGDLHAYRRYSQ
jgi:hypothetical protein